MSGPQAHIYYAIGLLCIVNAVSYIDRIALAVLAPAIKVDLGLSDADIGLLIGFAFSVFYASFGIPIARWADRAVRRDIIALSLVTWSAMTSLSGAAQGFWQLFATRAGMGAGEAGCFPAGASITCDCVPLDRRPTAFAVQNFGSYLGMMLGLVLAGWLGQKIGWRWTFVTLGLLGIALAIVVRFTLHEPRRPSSHNAPNVEGAATFVGTLETLWRCRAYRLLVLFMAVNGFVLYGMLQWWPSFYARSHGVGSASIGLYLGIAVGVGSGAGVLFGGYMAARAARRDASIPLLLGAAATTLAVPPALGTIFASSLTASMLLVATTTLLWSVSIGPVQALLYSVTPARMRATAGSLSIFVTSVLGFGLGPYCVGALSDSLASSLASDSLRYALLAPVCLLPVMTLILIVAARRVNDGLLIDSGEGQHGVAYGRGE